jgi:BTB/POZ domain
MSAVSQARKSKDKVVQPTEELVKVKKEEEEVKPVVEIKPESLVLDVKVASVSNSMMGELKASAQPNASYKHVVCNNLGKMLNDPQFSDFKFIVKGKEFKVHRNILAAASPVFTKLFTADMEEARTSECIVDDIEPEIFELLLRFIHKGKLIEIIGAVSVKLYEAAHYYQIAQLKGSLQEGTAVDAQHRKRRRNVPLGSR